MTTDEELDDTVLAANTLRALRAAGIRVVSVIDYNEPKFHGRFIAKLEKDGTAKEGWGQGVGAALAAAFAQFQDNGVFD